MVPNTTPACCKWRDDPFLPVANKCISGAFLGALFPGKEWGQNEVFITDPMRNRVSVPPVAGRSPSTGEDMQTRTMVQ
jgi:hypothetical protein